MARTRQRAAFSSTPPRGVTDELEELGDEAIVAHQTSAHLPQKRAQVADEARSIVISEPPPAGPASRPYRVDRGEPTIVIRDRRELDAARRRYIESQRRPRKNAVYLWLALAVLAFVLGGGVTFVLVYRKATEARMLSSRTAVAEPRALQETPVKRPPASAPAAPSDGLPKVKLEELPIEKPQHKPAP